MLFATKNKRVMHDAELYIDSSKIEQVKVQKFFYLRVILNSKL